MSSFYMHGLGHMLGIDVHDVGRYYYDKSRARSSRRGDDSRARPLHNPNTKDIPEQSGIEVRIEDDVLCTLERSARFDKQSAEESGRDRKAMAR